MSFLNPLKLHTSQIIQYLLRLYCVSDCAGSHWRYKELVSQLERQGIHTYNVCKTRFKHLFARIRDKCHKTMFDALQNKLYELLLLQGPGTPPQDSKRSQKILSQIFQDGSVQVQGKARHIPVRIETVKHKMSFKVRCQVAVCLFFNILSCSLVIEFNQLNY